MQTLQLKRCFIGNAEDNDEQSACCYIYGNWDPFSTSCIGLICENGMFEYRDIYTNKFVRYHLINQHNHEIINKTWLHFIFINTKQILFTFEDNQNIYKTSYRDNADISIFPNNLAQPTINNNDKDIIESFDIELRLECSDIIKCFDIDLKQHIVCGLQCGDIMIGFIDSKQDNEEEQLILIENCHSSEISAICGSLLNAFISAGKDQKIKIWDYNDSNEIILLHQLDIGTNGMTSIYPFRCDITNNELLAISTVEGIIFVYLLNDDYKLLTILNTKHQSEILDISSMTDGIMLSVSTLNGFVYLYDTLNFNQISFQKVSEKPVVIAKYKRNNNDFWIMDYDGVYSLYSETRPNTVYTNTNTNTNTNSTQRSDDIESIQTSTVSSFTVNTPKQSIKRNNNNNNNVFSNTTICSKQTPFHLMKRDRNIVNPLKNVAVLNKMEHENKENIDPISANYNEAKESSISKYYKNKIKQIENTKFDVNTIKSNDHHDMLSDIQRKHLKRIKIEEQRRKNMQKIYDNLPIIPSKNDIMKVQFSNVYKQNKKKVSRKPSIEPSIKPFIKRSLQPEKRIKITPKHDDRNTETVNYRKTISFTKKMAYWSNSMFNQPS